MTCAEFLAIARRQATMLSLEEFDALAAHLEGCPDCLALVDGAEDTGAGRRRAEEGQCRSA